MKFGKTIYVLFPNYNATLDRCDCTKTVVVVVLVVIVILLVVLIVVVIIVVDWRMYAFSIGKTRFTYFWFPFAA